MNGCGYMGMDACFKKDPFFWRLGIDCVNFKTIKFRSIKLNFIFDRQYGFPDDVYIWQRILEG